jgi:hypothetical protein
VSGSPPDTTDCQRYLHSHTCVVSVTGLLYSIAIDLSSLVS